MSVRQGIRVTSSTTGMPSHGFEEFRVNYVYGGSNPAEDEVVSAPLSESSSARKRRRMEKLAELEAIDPPLSLAEKARRMGLAPKTVRGYIRELGEAGHD